MMMKAAKLGWAGPEAGQEQGRSRAGAKHEQGRAEPQWQEEGWIRAGAELSRVEQSRIW